MNTLLGTYSFVQVFRLPPVCIKLKEKFSPTFYLQLLYSFLTAFLSSELKPVNL